MGPIAETVRGLGSKRPSLGALRHWTPRLSSALRWLAYGLFLAVAVHQLLEGRLDRDHGWYRAAADAVLAGQLPYVDFPFTQGPLFAYALAGIELLGGSRVGVRSITILLGFLTVVLAARLTDRLAGPRAAAVCAVLLAVHPGVVRSLTLLKPYALTTLLLLGVGLVLARVEPVRRRYLCAGLLVGLAVAIRHSAVVALPAVLAVAHVDPEAEAQDLAWTGLSFLLVLGPLLAAFLALAPERVWFDLVGYHLSGSSPTGLLAAIAERGSAVLEAGQRYLLYVAAAVAGLAAIAPQAPSVSQLRDRAAAQPARAALVLILVGLVTVQVVPRAIHVRYPALWLPLLAVLLAPALVALGRRIGNPVSKRLVLLSVLLVAGANVGAEIQRTETIVYEGAHPTVHERVASQVQAHVPEGQPVLTLSPVFAVLADRPLVDGYEMGSFYYEPGASTERARDSGTLNTELVIEDVRSEAAEAVVLRQSQLASMPDPAKDHLRQALDEHYPRTTTAEVGGFIVEIHLPPDAQA